MGAQGTVCAGGRYDGLVEQLGGKPVAAAGFALGIERLVELVKSNLALDVAPHAYFVIASVNAVVPGMQLSEALRDQLPGLRLLVHCGGGSFKSQFKKADKSGALVALILGDDELANKEISIKFLREDKPQQSVPQDGISAILQNLI